MCVEIPIVRRRAGVVVAVLAVVLVCGCGGGDGSERLGSLGLMQEATERARADHRDALLVQILGVPGAGGLVKAGDTQRWEFDFMIADDSAGLVIVRTGDQWSEPLEVPPFFGVIFDDLNRISLDLAEALARLRAAGYTDAYDEWNLFQPLIAGNPPPYYYFFGGTHPFPGVMLRVDAMTGAVGYDPAPGG